MTEIVIGGDSSDIPAGSYPGTLTSLDVKHSDKFDSDFRVWTFSLDSGSTVEGSSSMATSSKSKGGKWLAALLGRPVVKGETVDPIGSRGLVVVVIGDDEWPKVETVVALPSQTAQDAPGREDEAGVASEPAALDF